MSKQDDYRCVQIKLDSIMDYDSKQAALEKIIVSVGGKLDGGGGWISHRAQLWRDVFFTATNTQFKKIIKQAKEKGLVIELI
jgi:hypothetical protein